METKKKSGKYLFILVAMLLLTLAVLVALALLIRPSDGGGGSSNALSTTGGETTETVLPPNPYSVEDFGYEDGYLTCLSGASLTGIDVSSHQGKIQWDQVAGSGFSFAMVRLGYRGYSGEGRLVTDEWAQANLDGASQSGMQVGAYFFSQAISEEEAREEARLAIEILDGRPLDLPVVFDWEIPTDLSRTINVDADRLTAYAKAFCDEIQSAGYKPMIYFNPYFAERYLHLEELKDIPFWLASYGTALTFPHRVDMWQYTDTGVVSGIEGPVDIDMLLLY